MQHLPQFNLSDADQSFILELARKSITFWLINKKTYSVKISEVPEHLKKNGACFVTLFKGKELRGCIGSLYPDQPLYLDVIDNAINAATRDYRFQSISSPNELERISIEISVLNEPFEVKFQSESDLLSRLDSHFGVILSYQGHKATFLPSVWDSLPEPREFLEKLKIKAGLPVGFYNKDMQVYFYSVLKIESKKP